MKFQKVVSVLDRIKSELGDPNLVVSISSGKDLTITISTRDSVLHSFREGDSFKACCISPEEFDKDSRALAKDIAALFKSVLIRNNCNAIK